MKATINGIAIEGSPQEIAEYLKCMDDMRRDGVHIKPPIGAMPDWLKGQLYTPKAQCTGPCYCTGKCFQ